VKQTFEYLESFAVMALLSVGLTGASYHLFRDGGWVEAAGGSLWAFITDSPLMALGVILSSIVLTWMWRRSRSFQKQNTKAATAVFYTMLASGAYFLGRLTLVGTF
jgi:membrane protein implicated in regulation of membrane protease activity